MHYIASVAPMTKAVKPRGRNGGRKNTKPEGDKQSAPKAVWDFTAWCSQVGEDPRPFYELLKGVFKSATWSLEKAPSTGALHFQGRGSLFKKLRPGSVSAGMAKELGFCYFQPTSAENVGNTNYQQKTDSHVAGPWSIKEPPSLKSSDVTFIERIYDTLLWLHEMVNIVKGSIDPRTIYWVYDPTGNGCKSAAQRYLSYHKLVELIPFVENHKDLLQFAHGYSHKRAYCVNIARGCAPKDDKERKEFASFIAGLESLKDGFVFDIRHNPKKEEMERPHLIVFANCKPIFDSATRDRWQILEIDSELKFVNVTQQVLEEHDAYMERKRSEWDMKNIMKEIRLKRKWDAFVDANPEAAELLDVKQQSRRDKQEADRLARASRALRNTIDKRECANSSLVNTPAQNSLKYVFEPEAECTD